jgi:two-component system, OmpR family, response regulator
MRDKSKRDQGVANGSRRLITTGEAAGHCQVSLPALRRWIRDGRLKAFQTPGKHARIEVREFQRFLKQYGMPPYSTDGIPAGLRVLVVEDEPQVVEVLTGLLAAHPRHPTVETASDGYEALIKVGSFRPTFLILDIVMPKLDGLEVCRRLRADPETRDIKILAVTGREDLVPSVLAAGADGCIAKPFGFDVIDREIERLLGPPDRAAKVPAEGKRRS